MTVTVCFIAGAFSFIPHAFAFGDNPTPYDPVDRAEENDSVRSSSRFFILDATLPNEYQRALDDRKFIGITGLSFSGSSSSMPMNQDTLVFANDLSILSQPKRSCAFYAPDLCYDIKKFYMPSVPQLGIVGLFALDGSTILQWGVNTGFESQKLTVSPAVMIGLAKRFYFSDARDKHLIIEASTWFGERVKHRPCLDDYNREFYCGSVSPWVDFSYDPHPQSNFLKLTYEMVF